MVAIPDGFQLLAPSRLMAFARSPIVSPLGKARMALDLLLPAGGPADESLANFVRRRLGSEALARIAQPMIGGIYTADPEKLSLAATMPRFVEMEKRDRSLIISMLRARFSNQQNAANTATGPRYDLFVSLSDGLGDLVGKLCEAIGSQNVRTRVKVDNLERETDGWKINCSSGDTLQADSIIVATPAWSAAGLIRRVDSALADLLSQIEYSSALTVNLVYKRSDVGAGVKGFGFVVPACEKRNILACTFSSLKYPQRCPDDKVLLRTFMGGALFPGKMDLGDKEVVDQSVADLRKLTGTLDPIDALVTRWPNSMPQYHVGHLARVEQIEAIVRNIDTLELCGNAYSGVGIADCVHSGRRAADLIATAAGLTTQQST